MKKITIFLAFVLMCAMSFAQKVYVPLGAKNSVYEYAGSLTADSVMLFGVFSDTPHVNMNNYQVNGRVVGGFGLDTTSGNWKGWNPVTKAWAAVGGGTQDLQSVTDLGNITTNNLEVHNNTIGHIGVFNGGNQGSAILGTGNGEGGFLNLTTEDGFAVSLNAIGISQSNNIQLPNISGTLGESVTVNSSTYHSDGNGNINIGAIGGGGGSTNGNVGSGYRLAIPATNNIKTLHAGTNITIDSAAHSNELTINANAVGNYGNLQLNRNGVFTTPASDSLTFGSGFLITTGGILTHGFTTYNAAETKSINLNASNPSIDINGTSTTLHLNITNITSVKNLEFPNVSGVLAESVTVNGTTTHSDNSGNINVGSISGSPVGNYGNLQLNRNNLFATPASDSLNFSSAALNIKGGLSATAGVTLPGLSAQHNTDDSFLVRKTSNGVVGYRDLSILYNQYITQALTDGATITMNCSLGYNGEVTLGGNRTLAFSNFPTSGKIMIKVSQDGTGGRTLTLPSGSKVPLGFGGGTTINLSTGGAQYDILYVWKDAEGNYNWTIAKNFQ